MAKKSKINWDKIKKNAEEQDKARSISNLYAESVDRSSALDRAASQGRKINTNFAIQTGRVENQLGKAITGNRNFIKSNYGNDTYKALLSDYAAMKRSPARSYYSKPVSLSDAAKDAYKPIVSTAMTPATSKTPYKVGEATPLNERKDYINKSKRDESFVKKDFDYRYINSSTEDREKFKKLALSHGGRASSNDSLFDAMTQEQVAEYNYIYKTQGKKSAKNYLDKLAKGDTGMAANAVTERAWREFTMQAPKTAEALRLVSQAPEGISGIVSMGAGLLGNDVAAHAGMQPSIAMGSVNREITNEINNWSQGKAFSNDIVIGGKNFGNMYTVGYQALDSAGRAAISSALLTGGNPGAAFSSEWAGSKVIQAFVNTPISLSSYGDDYYQQRQSGATDMEAKTNSLVNSMVEWSTEMMGGFFGLEMGKGFVAQPINEGLEEITGNLMQRAIDIIDSKIKGKDNEIQQEYKELIASGKTSKEAIKILLSRYAAEDAIAFISAAIPMMGTTGVHMAQERYGNANVGSQFTSDQTKLNGLLNFARSMPKGSETQKLLDKLDNKRYINKKSLSNADIGELYYATIRDVNKSFNEANNLDELNERSYAISDNVAEAFSDEIDTSPVAIAVANLYQNAVKNIQNNTVEETTEPTEEALEEDVTEQKASPKAMPTEEQTGTPKVEQFKISATQNGNPVVLTSVAEAGGKTGIVFNTQGGNKVSFAGVNYANPTMNKIVSEASKEYDGKLMGAKGVESFINGIAYKLGETARAINNGQVPTSAISSYSQAAKIMYNIGYTNSSMAFDTIRNNDAVTRLGVDFAEDMFLAGQEDAKAATKKYDEEKGNKRGEAKKYEGNNEGKVTNETGDEKAELLLKAVGSASGDNIILSPYAEKENGHRESITGTVLTTLASSRGMAGTLAHEVIGEAIRAYNPEGFANIKKALREYFGEKYGFEVLAKETIAYENTYKEAPEDASEEQTCDMISAVMFGNKYGQQAFAKWLSERADKSLVQNVVDFVKTIVDTIKAYTKTGKYHVTELAMLNLEKEKAEEFSKLILEEYDKAINNKNAKEGVESDNTVFSKAVDINGNDVVLMENNILKGVKSGIHNYVANEIATHIGEVYTIIEDGERVYIGEDLPTEYTQSKYTRSILKNSKIKVKHQSVQNLGEMIEISTIEDVKENKKTKHNVDAKYGWYYYRTRVGIPKYDAKQNIVGVDIYTARLVIRHDADGKKYLYDIDDINKEALNSLTQTELNRIVNIAQKGQLSTSVLTLPQEDENVNTQKSLDISYMKAAQSGNEAEAQKYVDQAAMEWGAYSRDSKTPLRLYHGTSNGEFFEFDTRKTGSNYGGYARLGKGFYFAKTKNDAKHWAERGKGNKTPVIMPVYLNMGNATNALERVPQNVLDYIVKNNPMIAELDEYTLEYNARTLERFIDTYNLLSKTASEPFEDFSEIMQRLGYDGVYSDVEFVVYDSNQIKSAEAITKDNDGNVIPLSERFSDSKDIRYSKDIDSLGNELTTEQQEYFKDSKVRDTEGRLKVVYHGGQHNNYTVFDREKANKRGVFGSGFYFTDDKSRAQRYGNKVRAFYVAINNPLIDYMGNTESRIISKRELTNYIDAVINLGKGDEDIGSFANYYAEKSHSEVIRAAAEYYFSGDVTEATLLFNDVIGTTYDGFILPTDIVTFNSNQAKLIDNKAPSSNDDMRFSLDIPVEETKDLIAVHNLSEGKLLKSLRLGGLPMPSIAIIRAESGHNDFGNISLVFPKSTINPANKKNVVWSGDAYTPTFPTIDYKIDSNMVDDIDDRINDLLLSKGYRPKDFGYLPLDSESIERAIRFEDLGTYFAKKTKMIAAYLIDKGIDFKPSMWQKRLSNSNYDNEAVITVANAIGEDRINEAINDSEKLFALEPELMAILNEDFENRFAESSAFMNGEPLYTKDNFGFADADTLVRGAREYLQNGITETVNESETGKVLNQIIDDNNLREDLNEWISNLFDGVVLKEGLRNNVDIFTPSGNRRSWEALHYENNLENVVKAMKLQQPKGKGALGGNILGAAAQHFNSINEIKEASGKLQDNATEDYYKTKKELSQRIFELAKSIPIHDSFMARDDAAEMLIEAVVNYDTKTGMDNYIRRQCEGWANYSPHIVDDLMALVEDIRALPVSYFEAKPQRAVSFNEIYTAIIPDNSSAELIDALDNANVKYQTYEAGNEQSRVDILNSLEDVKFSKDVDIDNTSALVQENKKLQEAVDYYKMMLGYNNTEGGEHKVKRESIRKIASEFKRTYNSTMETDEINDRLTELYDYISSGKADWNTVFNMGKSLGIDLVESQKGELTSDQEDALNILKDYNISITDSQRSEIANYYDNVSNWLNIVRKGVKYSTTGIPLETAWGELAERLPYYFNADTNSNDMPMRLAEAVESITTTSYNDYGYTDDEMAEMIAYDLYDEFFDLPEIVTPLDKAHKELLNERKLNRERIESVKAKDKARYDRDIQKLKDYYQDINKRLRDSKNESTLEKLAKQKAKYEDKALKQKDTRERSALRKSIRKHLNKILTMAANPTKDKHIPNSIIEGVRSLAEAVTLDGTKEDERLTEKLNNFRNGFVDAKLKGDTQYAILSDLYNQYISEKIDALNSEYANTPLKELPVSALREIRDLIIMTGQTINNINRLFNKERSRTISTMATATNQSLDKILTNKRVKVNAKEGKKASLSGFFYDNMKPVYFFDYLNIPTLTELFQDLRDGEDLWITLYHQAEEFKNKLRNKVRYNDWDLDARKSFNTVGGKIELTLGEMLAVYANSLGEHTSKNILGGGFVYDTKSESGTDYSPHRLSMDDVTNIVKSLTPSQREYVQSLINYMSSQVAEWGNQVSREMYGVELFKESTYYPAKIAKDFRHSQLQDKNIPTTRQLVNSGFTNAIIPNVKNPVVLTSFDETVLDHIVNMISYRAFVMPLENFQRVYHYIDVTQGDEDTIAYNSVSAKLKTAYGVMADAYINHLIEDINGGALASQDYTNKLISLFKKGAVFASASVVVQQPSAIGRALAIINPKYFIGNPLKGFNKAEYKEMLEYCPIARIKELGYFDTGMAKSAVDSLNRKEYEGIERVKAFVTDGSFRDDALSYFAAKADEITWTHIWNACKNEAMDKYPNLSAEEQKQKAAERFKEVITKTQVYDSVFSRSGTMRNKSIGMKMSTSFMAEPLTNLNMLVNAITKVKRGEMSVKDGGRVLGSLVLASTINAVLQTLVTAARHDKDDDDWKEHYLAELLPNMLDNLNPAKQIPIVRDVISIFEGYDVTRTDMNLFTDLATAIQGCFKKSNAPLDEKIMGLAGAIANCFGLPIRNVYRDTKAAVNIVKDMIDGYHFTEQKTKADFYDEVNKTSTGKILKNVFDIDIIATSKSAQLDKVFGALKKGKGQDANKWLDKIRESYANEGKTESEINSAIKSAFTKEFKQAYLDGNDNTRSQIVEYLVQSGAYSSREEVTEHIRRYWKEDK